MKYLSQEPLVIHYDRKIFNDEECKFVIENSHDFVHATVYKDGERVVNRNFKSSSIYEDAQRKFTKIYEVLSKITKYPVENMENVLVTRYNDGEKIGLHRDWLSEGIHVVENDRVATLIVYLNEDFDGGDTVFPKLGISVTPKIGNVLQFRYAYDTELKLKTYHEGREVTNGTKYIAVIFVRPNKFVL